MKLNKKFFIYVLLSFFSAEDAIPSNTKNCVCCSHKGTYKKKHDCKFHGRSYFKRNIRSVTEGANAAIEALKFDHVDNRGVWDQDYISKNPQLNDLLAKFVNGQYAASLNKLQFKTNNIDDIVSTLEKAGFKLVTEKSNKAHCKSSTCFGHQKLYVHDDGSAVKLRMNRCECARRSNPHMIKLVIFNSNVSSISWQDVAFAVSKEGKPLPKSVKNGLRMPDESDKESDINFGWKELILQESVINISK